MYNKQLQQQQFQNQLAKEQARAGQAAQFANVLQGQAEAQGQMWAGIGQGLGQLGAGYMAYEHKYPQKPNQDIETSTYTQPTTDWRDAFATPDTGFDPRKYKFTV